MGKHARKAEPVMRTLIVEDEKHLAEALCQIMTEQRYQADVVYDGADGLGYALTEQYDAVIPDVMLRLDARCLIRGDDSVRMGFKEFEVLRLLMANCHAVVPKDDIIAKVWELESEAEDNNVEVYISFLRKKLAFLDSAVTIGTARKVDYFLEVPTV